jgi:enoyl-CoA hydratase
MGCTVTYKNFIVEMDEGVALVRINRPEALNALTTGILLELDTVLDAVESSDASVMIVTGEGKAFVAGADIAEMRNLGVEAARDFGALGSRIFRRLEQFKVPVIAAVNGYALGGGCELAMACDIRIASDKAKFGQPEVGLGIIPGFAGTQRLPRLVGVSKAKELIFTGEVLPAGEALAIGLVSKVVAPEMLLQTCRELAVKIRKNAPLAVRYAKAAIDGGLDSTVETGMALERDLFGLCFSTSDQQEGMAALLEKRAPIFSGK